MALFRAFTFEGKKTARKALDTIEENNDFVWIDDVAVVSVGKLGLARVDSTWAQSDTAVGAATGLGALTGALVGSMFGPQGALAGAAGGGSLAGLWDLGFEVAVGDPNLEEFASRMKPDTSALVLVADAPIAEEFISAVTPFNGVLIETDLDADDVKQIRKALKQD